MRLQRDIAVAAGVASPRAVAGPAMPQRAGHRRLDHAEHRHAVLDEGDVDGELAIALDELARAVERIDHPQPRPAPAQRRGNRIGGFLRQHRHVRRQVAQAGDDAAVRGEVGRGQRAGIGLVRDVEVVGVDREDLRGRRPRDPDDALADVISDRHGAAASRGR
jgi:hypothetical protein